MMPDISGSSPSIEEAAPAGGGHRKGRRGARSDQQLNNSKLVRAAGTAFATGDGAVSLADIARVADLSVATAYRHFDSADDALSAYRRDFGERLREFSQAQDASGLELVEAVSRHWVDLVLEEGRALVHRRSHEGFLARYLAADPDLSGTAEALRRPINELVVILGVGTLDGIQEEGAFLWNVLFDPRELFDLHETRGMGSKEIARRLVSAFRGALLGWATARMSEGN